MSMIKSFNLRVYGLLFNEEKSLLVSDELIQGQTFTKLPGGGVEFGEGFKTALMREFKEETGLNIEVYQHLYTTDFFQVSAFNPAQQLISVYYWVKAKDLSALVTTPVPFNFSAEQFRQKDKEFESFRWVKWENILEKNFNFPIDKTAIQMAKEKGDKDFFEAYLNFLA